MDAKAFQAEKTQNQNLSMKEEARPRGNRAGGRLNAALEKRRKSETARKTGRLRIKMSRISNMRVSVAALDLDAARMYLRAVEQMAAEGAKSDKLAVVLVALRLVELQAPRARAQQQFLGQFTQ